VKLPGIDVKDSIVRLRNSLPGDFEVVMEWLEESLHDQTLTNEATTNPNVLLHGCGYASSMRAILLALKE
jgi:hypothetical protein